MTIIKFVTSCILPCMLTPYPSSTFLSYHPLGPNPHLNPHGLAPGSNIGDAACMNEFIMTSYITYTIQHTICSMLISRNFPANCGDTSSGSFHSFRLLIHRKHRHRFIHFRFLVERFNSDGVIHWGLVKDQFYWVRYQRIMQRSSLL